MKRERMMLPLFWFSLAAFAIVLANFLIRNDDRSFQALLVASGLISPVVAYVFGVRLLRGVKDEA